MGRPRNLVDQENPPLSDGCSPEEIDTMIGLTTDLGVELRTFLQSAIEEQKISYAEWIERHNRALDFVQKSPNRISKSIYWILLMQSIDSFNSALENITLDDVTERRNGAESELEDYWFKAHELVSWRVSIFDALKGSKLEASRKPTIASAITKHVVLPYFAKSEELGFKVPPYLSRFMIDFLVDKMFPNFPEMADEYREEHLPTSESEMQLA